MSKTIEIPDFTKVIDEADLPIVAVYQNPLDYPGKVVARLWNRDVATEYVVIKDEIDDIRKIKPKNMIVVAPCKNDDPVIAEIWL